MENNFILTDDILWDYADGFLGGEEKLRVEAYLRQHPERNSRLEAILAEKRAFSAIPLENPDTGFAQKIMAAWSAEQAPEKAMGVVKGTGRDWILWGIAAAFGLMIAVPFLISPAAVPAEFTFQIPEEYIPRVPTFDWAGFLSSAWLRNTLLLLTAFIGLKILDKYLQVRSLSLSGR